MEVCSYRFWTMTLYFKKYIAIFCPKKNFFLFSNGYIPFKHPQQPVAVLPSFITGDLSKCQGSARAVSTKQTLCVCHWKRKSTWGSGLRGQGWKTTECSEGAFSGKGVQGLMIMQRSQEPGLLLDGFTVCSRHGSDRQFRMVVQSSEETMWLRNTCRFLSKGNLYILVHRTPVFWSTIMSGLRNFARFVHSYLLAARTGPYDWALLWPVMYKRKSTLRLWECFISW